MKVSELIEYLKTKNQDSDVKVNVPALPYYVEIKSVDSDEDMGIVYLTIQDLEIQAVDD